jgi:hypothetical protein
VSLRVEHVGKIHQKRKNWQLLWKLRDSNIS